MANSLKEGDNSLIPLNYADFLQLIIKKLSENADYVKLGGPNQEKLILDFDKLAKEIAQCFSGSIFGSEKEFFARMASINFSESCQQKFPEQIQKIYELLDHQLISIAQNKDFVKGFLIKDIIFRQKQEELQKKDEYLNLKFNFPSLFGIKKEELTLDSRRKGNDSCLKLHKVTIKIDELQEFEKSLQTGVKNYLDQEILPDLSEDDQDIVEDILVSEQHQQDLDKIKSLVDTEALGQLKRYTMIKYLEYLASHLDENKEKHRKVIYLKVLINRLKLLNDYLNDASKPDADYEVSLEGITVNLRQLLSRSEAFNSLPIIPIISSGLGETTDKNENYRQFVFGLKMKLNGEVQTSKGETSFKYHLNLMNPKSNDYQEEINQEIASKKETFVRKIIRNFCLYYFCLTSNCQFKGIRDEEGKITDYVYRDGFTIEDELNYNPLENWEKIVISTLKGNDEKEKRRLLAKFSDTLLNEKKLAIENKVTKLAKFLKEFLEYNAKLPIQEYPIHLSVSRQILLNQEEILAKNRLFTGNINKKEALQNVNVGEAEINTKTLVKLRGNLHFEDIRFYKTKKIQEFNLEYDFDNLKMLPVLFTPTDQTAKNQYGKLEYIPFIVFPYNFENEKLNNSQYFSYYLTLFLLIYLTLKVISDKEEERIFIPILRFHISNRNKKDNLQDLDKDMEKLSKVLVQLLGDKHLCNTQGFDLQKVNQFKINNGLTSLYSVIPKKFSYQKPEEQPSLDKIAMIVVSSEYCDLRRGSQDRNLRLANLYGEVITVNLQENNQIKFEIEKRISGNYNLPKMYSEPTIILDTVTNLYRQGYQHILYIAKTPYTSTLHLTKESQDNDGLFFLSKNLIEYLSKNNPDVNLYPIFCDQYYVKTINKKLEESLSVENTNELIQVSEDESKETVVFFNLFNGLKVGNEGDRFYNGVTSYSTLVQVYKKVMADQHIRKNLLDDSAIKKDILKYLTLFHFYRYEKSAKSGTQYNLKLNPYESIIGDDSVGKKSFFFHQDKKAEFNILAFLTEVRNAIL